MVFCMIFGTLAGLSVFPVFAADDAETEGGEKETIDYLNDVFETKEDKLATMELMLTRYGYELYYEPYTGEVGVKNTKTGDILLTNPYDIGKAGSASTENVKNQLLSQIIVKYSNNEGNELTIYSYVEAAQRDQIKVKKIKNGIRVEYVMGKQESRLLVPQRIEKSRFEELILANITDKSKLEKLKAFYVLKDPFDETLTDKMLKEMIATFPITEKYAIYVFDPDASDREKTQMEAIIKSFCPEYTYEQLEYDHTMVEYESTDKNPVQFRLALEYYLDESGLSVRLPANGIRFDQSAYQLSYIRILPYIGAGSSEFTGYTMIPDGSGALVRFEDILATGSPRVLSGSLYGADYAYHTIKGQNQQIMRLPIFGVIEDTEYVVGGTPGGDDTTDTGSGTETEPPSSDTGTDTATDTAPLSSDTAGEANTDSDTEADDSSVGDSSTAPENPPEDVVTYTRKSGYVAIIEEGDALASITTDHGGNVQHKYNSVYTEFNPRPKDSYNLASSISVAGDATWTVVSERKYTGSYRIRYIMLSDLEYAAEHPEEEIDVSGVFDTSYVGMALAYRNELMRSGVLQKLTSDKEQIPLYIETLGVMDVQDTFLSIPVTVKKPLTSFEDIKTITNELGDAGITNIIYKLTGYTNGGMVNTLPSKIDIEKAAGNEAGFKDLLSYADEKDIQVYLDMDFSYAKTDKLFDGFNKRSQAVKTIDNRYTQKRTYSATLQYFTSTGLLAVSPSVFSDIFASAESDLQKLGVTGVSLGTIGSDLNSDFDEDDPYNREDSKENVVKTLEKVREAGYSVMMDGGNAYAVNYAAHVLKVALDSSNFTYASEAVPMFGLIYHGYLNFAGSATNMAGDIRYEMLKILENGANPYFILVYQNSEKLKEDPTLSDYFSISYENWKEDLVSTYNQLNDALGPVMNSSIVGHKFVIGERVPTAEELAADEEAERLAAEEAARLEAEKQAEEERKQNLEEHLANKKGETSDESTSAEDTSGAPADTSGEPETSDTESDSETPEEPEEPEDDGYVYTKYTSDNGMIVQVTFENGYSFILNYNVFDVTVSDYPDTVISALGYIVIDPEGNIAINSGEEDKK